MVSCSSDVKSPLVPGLLLAALAFLLSLHRVADFDYWTHLALGREFWQARAVHIPEPFLQDGRGSLLAPFSWPFQIALYGIHCLGGDAGASVAVASAAALCAGLLWAFSARPSDSGRRALAWVWLAVVAYGCRTRFVPRPEIVGYALAAAAFPLACGWGRAPSLGKLWFLGGLLLLWRTFHVSWTAGALAVVAYLCLDPNPGFWRDQWASLRGRTQVLLLGVCAAAGAAVSVRFLGAVLRDVTSGKGALASVAEMQPLWVFPEVFWPFAALAGAGLACCWGGRVGRGRRLALWAFGAVLGTAAARNTALAALVLAPPAVEGLAGATLRGALSAARALALSLATAAGLLASAVSDVDPRWGVGVQWELFPRDAARFVQEAKLPAPVLNSFDVGGYLDWAWRGEPATFIDGRVSGENAAFADLRAATEATDADSVLARRGVQTVLSRAFYYDSGRLFPLVEWLLLHPGWRLVRATDALVFTREEGAWLPRLPASEGWRYVLREVEAKESERSRAPHLDYTKGLARFYLGDRDGAARAFREALARGPRGARAYAPYLQALGIGRPAPG